MPRGTPTADDYKALLTEAMEVVSSLLVNPSTRQRLAAEEFLASCRKEGL